MLWTSHLLATNVENLLHFGEHSAYRVWVPNSGLAFSLPLYLYVLDPFIVLQAFMSLQFSMLVTS